MITRLIELASGIGPLTHLEVRTLQGLPTWGAFTTDEWGGGALFDLGVHPLAVAVLATGAPGRDPWCPSGGTARWGGARQRRARRGRPHFRSGLVGRVVSSWQDGPHQTWDAELSSSAAVLRVEFWPRPTLEHNGDRVDVRPSDLPLPFIEELGYLDQLRSFSADIDRAATPFMDVEFGRAILDIVCAAYTSAGRGGTPQSVPFTGPRDRTPLQLWHGQ